MSPTPLVAHAFGTCVIHQCAQIKQTSHFTYWKRLDTLIKKTVWLMLVMCLPHAITVKWVKGIFTLFVINLQCKTCKGHSLCQLFVKDSTLSSSPMRCSTPLIDSQSPSLLVSSSGSRPQRERTFISCSVTNIQEEISSCRFHPIMNGFY